MPVRAMQNERPVQNCNGFVGKTKPDRAPSFIPRNAPVSIAACNLANTRLLAEHTLPCAVESCQQTVDQSDVLSIDPKPHWSAFCFWLAEHRGHQQS